MVLVVTISEMNGTVRQTQVQTLIFHFFFDFIDL